MMREKNKKKIYLLKGKIKKNANLYNYVPYP